MPDLRDHLNVSLFQTGVTPGTDFKFTKNADGTAAVEGFKVFRSGTFRDSLGIQHTWTDEHLTQMVANHEMLKARNLLPNVPVRADHSFSVDKLVGWIDGLYTDETFLRANFRFTEPEAAAKFDRGTYLNRSAEVGLYETNDEAFFWPVLMGFAFVDLPAVEGLFAASQRKYTVITDKETPVPEAPPPPPGSNPPPPPAPAGLHFRAAVGGPEQPVVFSINGQQTSDFMAVQNHIAVLEKFQADAVEAGRVAYVKQLAAGGKIAATQVESLTKFASSLTGEQFEQFKATWDSAPKSGLFDKHGDGITNPDGMGGGGAAGKAMSEIEQLEAVVAMHKRSGASPEEIAKMTSFQRLEALKAKA
jgi:hypothetical protein